MKNIWLMYIIKTKQIIIYYKFYMIIWNTNGEYILISVDLQTMALIFNMYDQITIQISHK